jgi:hypothetical protein
MAGAVGVERARQTLRADYLGERQEAAHGALLLNQEGGVDLAGGIVQGDDQVELLLERRQPAVR